MLFIRFKEYNESLLLYEENITIKKKLKINYAIEENKIGNTYYHRLKNYPLALQHYLEAVRLERLYASNSTGELGYYTRNLGYVYYRNNDKKQAMFNFKKAKEIFESIPDDFSIPLKGINEWIVYLEEQTLEQE